MTTKRDYYGVLGLGRNASSEDIKKAFRRLALQYHPDRNQEAGAEARFKEINEAYEVLSDPERRQTYDRFGTADLRQAAAGRPFDGFDSVGFGDIFDAFFSGNPRTRPGPIRGGDLHYRLRLTFGEAVFGCEKEVELARLDLCPRCHGSGGEPGTAPTVCPQCRGSGEVRRTQRSLFGQFVNVAACDRCGGAGQVLSQLCTHCKGAARVEQQRRLNVKVPAGVDSDSQIRLTGEGEAGLRGGPPGDLYIRLEVEPHPLFQREGDDIHLTFPITMVQATLGDELEVPTLNGAAKLKLEQGTQTGTVVRLRGKGVAHLQRGGQGDLYVHLKIATPTALNNQQKKLLQELAKSLGEGSLSSDDRKLLGKIRSALKK
ncbi:MAG: molecular chaperone DnaJ [Chloroflexi bacterium]|nr:molecular chaperone DnaJ [Chloroflexota bacterium]